MPRIKLKKKRPAGKTQRVKSHCRVTGKGGRRDTTTRSSGGYFGRNKLGERMPF